MRGAETETRKQKIKEYRREKRKAMRQRCEGKRYKGKEMSVAETKEKMQNRDV